MLSILVPVNAAMATTTFQLNINNTCLIQYMLVIKLYNTLIQNIPLFLIGSIPWLILHNQLEKMADISHHMLCEEQIAQQQGCQK